MGAAEPVKDNSAVELLIGGGADGAPVSLLGRMSNRHGLIAGATGTGKTVSLQVLAESFSRLGVPVFTADVKGDLAGLSQKGSAHPKIEARVETLKLSEFSFRPAPVLLWDLHGKNGHQVRTTIAEMGPILLSHLLELNETQEGVLHIAFRVSDDEGCLLLDLKDLRAMLSWLADHADEIKTSYGNVSPASVAAIQRRLLVLEEAGADIFFGEPALKIEHLMQSDFSGQGVISVLDARELIYNPRLYSTFLLWLLSELFEDLEEVGDAELPRLVFFFDEAHLLFDTASKALLERIETVARLVRSKGVGLYFVTQHPRDIPEAVLGQLGNRVQHALRSYTPNEKKALKAAVDTMPGADAIDAEKVVAELGVGEALVSVLDAKGRPTTVTRTLIKPPESRIGALKQEERDAVIARSPLKGVYDQAVDRESAYELLKKREAELEKRREQTTPENKKSGYKRQSATEAFFKSMLRTIGNSIGRQIVRGVLGSITGRKR